MSDFEVIRCVWFEVIYRIGDGPTTVGLSKTNPVFPAARPGPVCNIKFVVGITWWSQVEGRRVGSCFYLIKISLT